MKKLSLLLISLLFSVLSFCVNPYGEDSLQAEQKLKDKGYKCDGSLSDYKKFFDKHAIFGDYHEQAAIARYNEAENKLETFYSFCKQYGEITIEK